MEPNPKPPETAATAVEEKGPDEEETAEGDAILGERILPLEIGAVAAMMEEVPTAAAALVGMGLPILGWLEIDFLVESSLVAISKVLASFGDDIPVVVVSPCRGLSLLLKKGC